jgi:hypothetical protein
MMLRHLALFAVSLALLAACGHREKYPSYEESHKHKGVAPIPKVKDQLAKPVHPSDASAEKRLLESLPKDDPYIIVTGDALGQVSEELEGRLLRIDAVLVWLSPGAEAGMSTFETRDGRFEFDVSWRKVTSSDDMEQIIRIKERIYKDHLECKFRLYGRWAHEDSLLRHVRELTIDKWECVEW